MLFRYPGGKGKMAADLVGKIEELNGGLPSCYAEPFVGGGSVALAFARRADHLAGTLANTPMGAAFKRAPIEILLNDRDRWIASLWDVLADPNAKDYDALYEKVEKEPTLTAFKRRQEEFQPEEFESRTKCSRLDAAYNALFFNRTTFSGILRSGPIGGNDAERAKNKAWNKSGKEPIAVRWHVGHLQADLTEARGLLCGRTQVVCGEWSNFLRNVPPGAFLYLDPPYCKAGPALYGGDAWRDLDHEALRNALALRSRWLLSYDPAARELYSESCFRIEAFEHYRSMGNRGKVGARKERPRDESELLIYPA